MHRSSSLILPCDPNYTAHRDAERRRRETRDWLRQRERELAVKAPSIVPAMQEAYAPTERQRRLRAAH
jgi:hypothetical protein